MRWYCVHPSLPSQAELRIRAAPDSSAEERARISQGRAIAACSPAFQVPSDDAAAGPVSWLQVAYLDSASGETEGGFMMAELPDGMALVTPWEETDFTGCCEVTDPGALLFDGPDETARSLGAVPSIDFLYCTLEERGSRFRLFHPELASVWINKNSLQIVCTRLKHAQCCTSHSFYELNEALPEEAQVAIRESPSKEAQTTGLLSRGETLEVTVRSGNWLQISGGGLDRAWIMWRTDALELLQEAPDVWAKTCKIIAANTVDDDDANGDTADKNTTDKNVNTSNHGNDCPLLSENINNTNQDSTIDREAPRNLATDQARVNVDDVEVGAELDTDPAPDAVRTVADDVDDGAMEVGAVVDTVAASDPIPTGADNAKVNDIEVGAKLYTDPALYNVSVEPEDVKLDDVGVGAEIDADLTADNIGVESDDVEVNDVEVGAEEDANQVADDVGVESDDVEVDDVGVDADDDADQAADDVGVEQEDVEVDDVGVDADDDADQAADDVDVESDDVEVDDVGVDADDDADQAADDVGVESDDVEVDDVGVDADDEADQAADDVGVEQEDVEVDDVGVDADDDADQAADDVGVESDDVEVDDVGVDADDDADLTADDVGVESDDVEVDDVGVDADDEADQAADDVGVEQEDVEVDDVGVDADDDADQAADDVGVESDDVEVDDVGVDADDDADQAADDVGVESDDVEVDDVGVDADDEADQAADDVGVESDDVKVDDVEVGAEVDSDQAADDVCVNLDDVNVGAEVDPASAPDAVRADVKPTHAANQCLSRPTQADLNGDAFASFTATMQYSLQGIHLQDDQSIRTNETNMKQDRIPIDLRMTTDDSAAFDVVNTATSSTKLHGAQDRRYPSPSEPWNGFEKRYTESEATSGSENGEIALLGGLEDVFDPVDELLPEMPKKFMTTLVELASETTPVDPGADDVSEHLGSDEPLTRAERLGQGKLKQIPVSYESSGIAYLQQFGVGKYCELKQTLVAPIDELSQAVYEASHDDADLVFHALVGDDPLSDDWFHDVSLPAGSKEIVSCSSHLANRSTYDLIMANASPEDILAAELSDDDDEDFDLVIPFKYPAPKRRTINPRGSAASSLFRRVPSAPIGMTELESSPSSKPDGESGLQAIDPSLPNQRKSKIAETSPIPAPKVATPSKNLQSVPFPPPSKTKLLERKSIAAPSSIVKPPTSLMRPRSIMSSQSVAFQDSSLAKPTPSGLGAPSEVPKPTRSLLQRRSFLATPSPSKVSSGLGPRTSSILKPVESSGLQAPRKSFGFRRPSSLTKN